MNKGLAVLVGVIAIGGLFAYMYKDELKSYLVENNFLNASGSTLSKSDRIESARKNNCEFVKSHLNK